MNLEAAKRQNPEFSETWQELEAWMQANLGFKYIYPRGLPGSFKNLAGIILALHHLTHEGWLKCVFKTVDKNGAISDEEYEDMENAPTDSHDIISAFKPCENRMRELFEQYDKELLKFYNIPPTERLSEFRDLCGLLYLSKKYRSVPPLNDIIFNAINGEAFLSFEDFDELTREDVEYLSRCGIVYDSSRNRLKMVV